MNAAMNAKKNFFQFMAILFEDLAALPQLTLVIAKSLSDVDVKFSRKKRPKGPINTGLQPDG